MLLGADRLGIGLLRSVKSVDLRLMVLCVVERHDLFGNVGLKRIVRIRKRRKCVL